MTNPTAQEPKATSISDEALKDPVGREYREFTNPDGHTWREYKLDERVAKIVKELRLGLGCNVHSWRAVAIRVVGWECQMTGKDLSRLAQWTLDEEWENG